MGVSIVNGRYNFLYNFINKIPTLADMKQELLNFGPLKSEASVATERNFKKKKKLQRKCQVKNVIKFFEMFSLRNEVVFKPKKIIYEKVIFLKK